MGSWLKKVDARVKILLFISSMASIFLAHSLKTLLGISLIFSALFISNGLQKNLLDTLKKYIPFLALSFLLWFLYSNTSRAAFILFRLLNIILSSILFITTTTFTEIAFALNSLGLGPKVTLLLALSFQMVKRFQKEFEIIKEAELSRGARFDKFPENVRNGAHLVLPLTVRGIEAAEKLNIAINLNGFPAQFPKKRLKIGVQEGKTIAFLILLLLVGWLG